MPNPGADRPLRKVTLNLYEEDCVALEQRYGHGWSTNVRGLVQNHAKMIRERHAQRKTLAEVVDPNEVIKGAYDV